MAATRENVLSAIVEYVENNKRRAPAKAIAEIVGDTLPNVQAIVKALVQEGAIESSRGRNGGAKPVVNTGEAQATTEVVETEVVEAGPSDDVAAQFAALVAQLEGDGQDQAAVG